MIIYYGLGYIEALYIIYNSKIIAAVTMIDIVKNFLASFLSLAALLCFFPELIISIFVSLIYEKNTIMNNDF